MFLLNRSLGSIFVSRPSNGFSDLGWELVAGLGMGRVGLLLELKAKISQLMGSHFRWAAVLVLDDQLDCFV